MYAAGDSETCLRKTETQPEPFCYPLGGKSIVGSLTTYNESKSTMLISAQMSSRSLFDGIAYGANAFTSSLLTLYGVASSLGRSNYTDKNLIFALFNSETFDNTGSGRFVKDITAFDCQN